MAGTHSISAVSRYALALGVVAIVAGVQLATWPLLRATPYQLFYLAIILIAWKYGLGPGLLGVVASLLLVDYLFLEPKYVLGLGREAIAPIVVAAAAVVFTARQGRESRIARQSGARQQRRLAFLSRAGEVLAGSLDFEQTLNTVAELSVGTLGDWCVIDIIDEKGTIRRIATAHADPARAITVQRLKDFPPDPSRPDGIPGALRSGRAEVMDHVPEGWLRSAATSEEHFRILEELAMSSAMFIPLVAHQTTVGAVGLFRSAGEPYDQDDLTLATELARRAALSIEGARLFAAERRARADSESARHALSLIAEASAVFSAQLDFDDTAASIARLTAPAIADISTVDILEESGPRRVAVSASDPRVESIVRDSMHTFPADGYASARGQILAAGTPLFVPGAELLSGADLDPDPRRAGLLREIGVRALLLLPLKARGRTFGVLGLAMTSTDRSPGDGNMPLCEEIAYRAAVALDNARLYEDAQIANRAKDEFLATVSHEVRTPLNAILGWAQIMRETDIDPETASHALDAIERSAQTQARIIEDILDVSRVIAGKLTLELRPIDSQQVVQSAVAALRPEAEAKHVSLGLEVDGEIPGIVADADRIHQVLCNLLSNAVRHTPEGGRIEVSARGRPSDLEITVADNGTGIAPELLPHLFERFRQGDSQRQGSLGLGLSIVQSIVTIHGGTVTASSPGPGRGSTFTVRLPLEGPAESVPARTSGVEYLPSTNAPVPLAGLRILAVDDEYDARELLRLLLSRRGAEVRTAASVDEALEVAIEWTPHVVVSDIAMPGADGYELVRSLAALSTSGDPPPVIAITAFAQEEDRQRVLSAGFAEHVAKPMEPDRLIHSILRVVGEIHPR